MPRSIALVTGLISILVFASNANADNFPYFVGGKKWSATLSPPQDGRVDSGFTNGCVELDSAHKAVIDKYGRPVRNDESCYGNSADVITEATQACERIGGHLPTKAEYYNLIRSFKKETEYVENWGPQLTRKGIKAMSKVFGEDIVGKTYWMTGKTDFFSLGLALGGPQGFIGSEAYTIRFSRAYGGSVRCIEGLR